ncbi:Hypothetical predicted protein [Octopus vulgaris]|uniref:Uncharacterized protein n=1 Tax=Octopus vulgaris TaxID=6645 RepID=A0AA36BBX5_OCTVU|nr:Hypothetical predicted protein [Octopus vulgaris]
MILGLDLADPYFRTICEVATEFSDSDSGGEGSFEDNQDIISCALQQWRMQLHRGRRFLNAPPYLQCKETVEAVLVVVHPPIFSIGGGPKCLAAALLPCSLTYVITRNL